MVRGLEMEAFLDLDSIRAGDAWPDVLRQEIEDAYLGWVGWSRYAAQSAWVRREDTEALRKGPGALRIDLLDDTPLPPELEHIQAERSALGQPAAERLLQAPLRLLPEGTEQPSVLLRPEYGVVRSSGEKMFWRTSPRGARHRRRAP